MTVTPGSRLGRYQVRSKIGEGGMGEVYLASDTELDRTVAIKILPKAVASDNQRLQRFILEAKAASGLNHPHILTIYEVGTAEDLHFIATEFIDGDTLRHRIHEGMSLSEVLEVCVQIAGALSAAHDAGIVHRDIKPENVMLRRDGYVKVLDFGLAKLTEPKDFTNDTEAPTKAMVNTAAGTVIGTASYMSPEQAKGTHVDSRSDLWSLGVLLYEMVTRHLPFTGETPTETISLILQKEPSPITHFVSDIHPELDRIVTKALTKNRDDRYQTAKDLLIDLRNLKRRIEVDAEIDRTVPPELRAAATGSGSAAVTGLGHAAQTRTAPQQVSSAQYIVTEIKNHKLLAVAVLVAITIIVGTGWYLRGRNTETAIESIAVLPFENQNGNADTEYMSDGLTDSIINSLTQFPNLKVIARSSVFRYKGKAVDLQRVANELGVRAVLTGRILQRGDNLTIGTELIDARDNKQIWGEQYERKVSDLLSIQRAIAQQITSNLKLKLSGAERGAVAKSYTDNAAAYDLYLKGRFYWNKRTDDGTQKSVEYYNQAIELDPNYALAYAGLADSWFTAGWYKYAPPAVAYNKSKAAANTALSLDPKLAEAHVTIAMIKGTHEWDWTGAENEFKLAIELNPRYATAHHRYSLFLPILGRLDEAVAEAKKAQELDPLSLIINENVGDILSLARRSEEAEQQLLKTIELDANFDVAHQTLSRVYLDRGLYEKALEQGYWNDPDELARQKRILAQSGPEGLARDDLRYALEKAKEGDVRPFYLAEVYARLGDKDKCFEWLDKSLADKSIRFTYFIPDQRFDSIRSDPRYSAILQRVGLQK